MVRPNFLIGLLFTLGFSVYAQAEDSVAIWANYYKERSTRVFSPLVTIQKDLPYRGTLDVTYLVDQITSASAAFTSTDEAFQEYRQEFRIAYSQRLFDRITPGVRARYSHEPDYRSTGIGASFGIDWAKRTSALTAYFEHQSDVVLQRNISSFRDTLDTNAMGLGFTQIITPHWLVGTNVEAQFLDGFQENVYRHPENHPRQRNRYTLSAWTGYRIESWGTTLRPAYRFYFDTWELQAHSVSLQVFQALGRHVELIPELRWHSQNCVYFCSNIDGLITSDPKLTRFGAQTYGLRIKWTLHILSQTFLNYLSESSLQPSYGYLSQDNRYGPAHIAQLGWYWPY